MRQGSGEVRQSVRQGSGEVSQGVRQGGESECETGKW